MPIVFERIYRPLIKANVNRSVFAWKAHMAQGLETWPSRVWTNKYAETELHGRNDIDTSETRRQSYASFSALMTSKGVSPDQNFIRHKSKTACYLSYRTLRDGNIRDGAGKFPTETETKLPPEKKCTAGVPSVIFSYRKGFETSRRLNTMKSSVIFSYRKGFETSRRLNTMKSSRANSLVKMIYI
jgi:hypothetical protein